MYTSALSHIIIIIVIVIIIIVINVSDLPAHRDGGNIEGGGR
jgi:hypothetical protein